MRCCPLSVTILFLGCCPVLAAQQPDRPAPRVVFNDDAQVLTETPDEGAGEFVRAWLDREMQAVKFSTFVFLAATPDVCTYETRIGEVYGRRFGDDFDDGLARGIRRLRAEGTDALKVVCDHMHGHGKEVLAAIRMSDTHHTRITTDNPLCPLFAVEHPEFVIRQPDERTNETALDYSHPEVRSHRLAIMKEIVENYDVDGLELNFVRWAKHFPRDQGREKAHILTSYMGELHQVMQAAARTRGRDSLTLGIRVPESLAACWLAGVDVQTWVRRGWIDYLVISTWNNTDPQLRVGEFSQFTRPAGVDTIVVMGNMMGCIDTNPPLILDRPVAMSAKHAKNYQGMLLTASEARGAAANYYTFGADSISFWNVGIHFGGAATATPEQRQRIARWTSAVSTPEAVFDGSRTYRYLPMGKGISNRKPPVRNYPWYDENRSPLGHQNSPILRFGGEVNGARQVFPFLMADGRDGKKIEGRMTFWVYHLDPSDELAVDINGRRVSPRKISRLPVGDRRGGLPGQRVEIALRDCPPFAGENELGVAISLPADSERVPYLEELEVQVK
jgi:hypothetical protein